MKTSLEGLNSRFELAEKKISKLDNRSIEIMQSENREKKEFLKK